MSMPSGAWGFQSPGLVEAQTVIIEGPKGGLFVYSPSAGLGNLVLSIAAQAGTDKFGNAYPAGETIFDTTFQIESSGQTRTKLDQFGNYLVFNQFGALIFILAPSGDGYFLYQDTGSAVQGALSISNVVTAGTDQFGNPYLAGLSSYQGSVASLPLNAVQMNNGVFNFLSWDNVGLAWVNDSEIFSGANGRLLYTAVSGGSSPGDGNTYGLGKIVSQLTTGPITSTGTTPIPVLTMNVSPGKYLIRGVVFGQQGTVAATQNLAFQGTATRSNTSIATIGIQTGALENAFAAVINSSSSTQVTGATPANAGENVTFEGLIIVSAGGTFTLSIADGTAGDHWKANNNTYMVLEPVN